LFLVPAVLREVIPDKPAETQDSGYAELKEKAGAIMKKGFSIKTSLARFMAPC
jgi:hypothetical protein